MKLKKIISTSTTSLILLSYLPVHLVQAESISDETELVTTEAEQIPQEENSDSNIEERDDGIDSLEESSNSNVEESDDGTNGPEVSSDSNVEESDDGTNSPEVSSDSNVEEGDVGTNTSETGTDDFLGGTTSTHETPSLSIDTEESTPITDLPIEEKLQNESPSSRFINTTWHSPGSYIGPDGVNDGGYIYQLRSDCTASIDGRTSDGTTYRDRLSLPGRVTYNGETYRVTEISANAFSNSNGGTVTAPILSVDLSRMTELRVIGSHAFYNCQSLEAIPSFSGTKIVEIGNSAFSSTPNVSNTVLDFRPIAGTLETIGDSAFGGNQGSIKNVTEIYFTGASKLQRIGGDGTFGGANSRVWYIDFSGTTSLNSIGDWMMGRSPQVGYISLEKIETHQGGAEHLKNLLNSAFISGPLPWTRMKPGSSIVLYENGGNYTFNAEYKDNPATDYIVEKGDAVNFSVSPDGFKLYKRIEDSKNTKEWSVPIEAKTNIQWKKNGQNYSSGPLFEIANFLESDNGIYHAEVNWTYTEDGFNINHSVRLRDIEISVRKDPLYEITATNFEVSKKESFTFEELLKIANATIVDKNQVDPNPTLTVTNTNNIDMINGKYVFNKLSDVWFTLGATGAGNTVSKRVDVKVNEIPDYQLSATDFSIGLNEVFEVNKNGGVDILKLSQATVTDLNGVDPSAKPLVISGKEIPAMTGKYNVTLSVDKDPMVTKDIEVTVTEEDLSMLDPDGTTPNVDDISWRLKGNDFSMELGDALTDKEIMDMAQVKFESEEPGIDTSGNDIRVTKIRDTEVLDKEIWALGPMTGRFEVEFQATIAGKNLTTTVFVTVKESSLTNINPIPNTPEEGIIKWELKASDFSMELGNALTLEEIFDRANVYLESEEPQIQASGDEIELVSITDKADPTKEVNELGTMTGIFDVAFYAEIAGQTFNLAVEVIVTHKDLSVITGTPNTPGVGLLEWRIMANNFSIPVGNSLSNEDILTHSEAILVNNEMVYFPQPRKVEEGIKVEKIVDLSDPEKPVSDLGMMTGDYEIELSSLIAGKSVTKIIQVTVMALDLSNLTPDTNMPVVDVLVPNIPNIDDPLNDVTLDPDVNSGRESINNRDENSRDDEKTRNNENTRKKQEDSKIKMVSKNKGKLPNTSDQVSHLSSLGLGLLFFVGSLLIWKKAKKNS